MEERDGIGLMNFEVSGRDEASFIRLLELLPDVARYKTYAVYRALSVNKHVVGKYGAVN